MNLIKESLCSDEEIMVQIFVVIYLATQREPRFREGA